MATARAPLQAEKRATPRRYAHVDATGKVVNVSLWAGPDVCPRCGDALNGAPRCPADGAIPWSPPEGITPVLAEDGGGVGDTYANGRFTEAESVPAEKTRDEKLADLLVAKGVATRAEVDALK